MFQISIPGLVPWIPYITLSFDDVAFPLYRYTQLKFHSHFVMQGLIRLGTLYGYHDETALGTEVGDLTEGAKLETSFTDLPNIFVGTSINAWVMSLTREKNDEFYEAFAADCCIEILGPEYFFEIAKAARKQAFFGGLYQVKYGNISEGFTLKKPEDDPFLIMQWKPEKYKWQKEVRFSLEPWSPIPGNTSEIAEEDSPMSRELISLAYEQGIHALAYKYARNFPYLQPIILNAPLAIPFARIVGTKS